MTISEVLFCNWTKLLCWGICITWEVILGTATTAVVPKIEPDHRKLCCNFLKMEFGNILTCKGRSCRGFSVMPLRTVAAHFCCQESPQPVSVTTWFPAYSQIWICTTPQTPGTHTTHILFVKMVLAFLIVREISISCHVTVPIFFVFIFVF